MARPKQSPTSKRPSTTRTPETRSHSHQEAEFEQEALERRFRTTFENAAVGMAHVAPDGTFLLVNRKLCEITGYSQTELLNKTFMDITHPDDLDADMALDQQLSRGDIPDYTMEKRYIRKDGSTAWVRLTETVSRNRTGDPEFFIAVVEDVSELKKARRRETAAAIQATAAQTAMDTVNAMGEGVVVCHADGAIRDVNPAFEELTEMSTDTLKGKNIRDILPDVFEETPQTVRETLTEIRIRSTTDDLMHALTVTTHRGESKWVVPTLTAMHGPEGEGLGIVLSVRDISPLVKAQIKLRERDRQYRELVENANSIIMRITPDHRITFFNEYAQAFFGYTRDEVIGKSVIGTIAPEIDSDGRNLRTLTEEIAAHPETHGASDNENMRKDGRRVWIHWSNRAIRDPQGNVKEILCVGNDITARRRLEHEAEAYRERLKALADRLTAAEEQERRRVATQIHDTVIQTLSLSNIRLGGVAAALAEAGMDEPRKRVEDVRKLLDQGTRECRGLMDELVPSLLYEVGLHAAIKDFADRHIATDDGTRIIVHEDEGPTNVDDALKGLLFQCARELLVNALKYAGPCEIHIDLSTRDDGLQLRVKDSGRGFDPSILDEKTHSVDDGGFGLFSIRERLNGINGRLTLESSPGNGTTATVLLP